MIILDTNVISEAMKADPHPAVRAGLDEQAAETLYLTSVTLAELLFGIGALPSGRRKDMLSRTLDGLLALFDNRTLAFDGDAALRDAVATFSEDHGLSKDRDPIETLKLAVA